MANFCAISVIFFVTLLVVVTDAKSSNNRNFTGSNLCSRLEKYNETHVVSRTFLVREDVKVFCLAIPPYCIYPRYKLKKKNETIVLHKSRTVFECCQGYEKKNKSCVPACTGGCGHGECVEPSVCHCEPGWRGDNCNQICELNRYGRNCKQNCTCEHGAKCDRKTGFCHCKPGYTGTYCEFPCPEGTYGQNCSFECTCKFGAICDIKDGYCECQPGYSGDDCEFPCEHGYHGPDCEQECICIMLTTEVCSHIDGKCTCKKGFTGEYCEKQCGKFTYGFNCSQKCQCENANFCDAVTGECFCEAGWIGKTCAQKCPTGYFGYGCKDKCRPCENENQTCNHVTGICTCPTGSFGNFCEKACPKNRWGSLCLLDCDCSEYSTCDAVTGECICNPGWMGSVCNETCPDGKFGYNCTSDCLCKNCDAATGSCNNSATGSAFIGARTGVQSLIIGVFCVLFVFLLFLCLFCGKKHAHSIRNWWISRNARRNAQSSESIVGASFPNPLYDNVEAAGNSERSRTERNISFIDLASTIREKLSFVSKEEVPSSSSAAEGSDPGSSLRRTSKISNLSAVGSTGKDRKSKTSMHATTPDADDESVPESVSDFNTPENIIGTVSDSLELKNELRKND